VNPAWINLAISVFLLGTMGYNLAKSAGLWWRERGARALRGVYIASMLEVGMLFYLFAALGRLQPAFLPYARFLGAIVLGMLLVGSIVITLTWLVPDVREALRRE